MPCLLPSSSASVSLRLPPSATVGSRQTTCRQGEVRDRTGRGTAGLGYQVLHKSFALVDQKNNFRPIFCPGLGARFRDPVLHPRLFILTSEQGVFLGSVFGPKTDLFLIFWGPNFREKELRRAKFQAPRVRYIPGRRGIVREAHQVQLLRRHAYLILSYYRSTEIEAPGTHRGQPARR